MSKVQSFQEAIFRIDSATRRALNELIIETYGLSVTLKIKRGGIVSDESIEINKFGVIFHCSSDYVRGKKMLCDLDLGVVNELLISVCE
jgi:hypothetical protein